MISIELHHESLPYFLSTDLLIFDMDRVCHWLSKEAYWSGGISKKVVIKSFKNSLVFGLFHSEEGQVGVARMVTDRATFAYLGDVFVDEACRGHGLGKWMMEFIMAHPDLQGLRRMMLATSDMHALYRQFGFKDVGTSKILMEIVRSDIYKVAAE